MKPASHDAIKLLVKDHHDVKAMFEEFDQLSSRAKSSKKKLADRICHALTLHAQVEEEIFYPAALRALHDQSMVDEAVVEHASAKELIAQILSMQPGDDLYDAKVKVLSEQIEHHVKEEEKEMFPKTRKTKLDLEALGLEMIARKEAMDEKPPANPTKLAAARTSSIPSAKQIKV